MTDRYHMEAFLELEREQSLPLHLRSWWNDAVCGKGNWEVRVEEDARSGIHGILVYRQKRRFGMTFVSMPPLTAYSGLWLTNKEGFDDRIPDPDGRMKVVESLCSAFHQVAAMAQSWHPEMMERIPLEDSSFRFSTRETFRLQLTDQATIFQGFETRVRTNIRNAEGHIHIAECNDAELLVSLMHKSFAARDMKQPYDPDMVASLFATMLDHGAGKIFLARDQDDRPHAAILVGYDDRCAYYITGGSDPALRKSGAVTALLWHAIRDRLGHQKIFDFEGSNIPGIYFFFRGFGGELTPYPKVMRKPSLIIKGLSLLRGLEYYP